MKNRDNNPTEFCYLQKLFTAYVTRAVQRERQQYLQRMERRLLWEKLQDGPDFETSFAAENNVMAELPLLMRIENDALLCALKALTERERYIFLYLVLCDKPF